MIQDIEKQLARHEADDRQYAKVEGRLRKMLGRLTAANAADQDRRRVALRVAQVQAIRASIGDERAKLAERELDARARVQAARFMYEGQRAVQALKVEAKLAKELRFAIRGCGTQYRKWLRVWRTAMEYLAQFDALPDSASQSTWKDMSILVSLRKAFPGIAALERLTEHDATRPERLGLWEWGGRPLLHKGLASGEGLACFYKREKDGSQLKRVAAALQDDPRITKILSSLKSGTSKEPESPKPKKKQSRKQRK